MKVLLSILFLLALADFGRAENFDNIKKVEKVRIFSENIHISGILKTGVCDEQDSNDYTGPDLFFEGTGTNVQTFKLEVKKVYVFLPFTFITALQYSLIDLPPPSFS